MINSNKDISFEYVNREVLLDIRKRNNGKIIITDDKSIPVKTRITAFCNRGHSWTCPAGNLGEWCKICKLLDDQHKSDTKIYCMQKTYNYGQAGFEFVCSAGHRYIIDSRCSKKGCRSCNLLNLVRKIDSRPDAIMLDIKCLNVHNHSKLRFHCNKLRHNPFCENPECRSLASAGVMSGRSYSANCTDFVICDQDFYATPMRIMRDSSCLDCDTDHKWGHPCEVYSTIRMFEALYDRRFDDSIYGTGVEFSGYNEELKIAYTLTSDASPAKYIDRATEWCKNNSITFVVIPKNLTDSGKIATYMITELQKARLIHSDDITEVSRQLGYDRKGRAMRHKLFDDRCVFS